MNFLFFWRLNDTDGCSAVIKIIGIGHTEDEYPEKVYYVTESKDSPDYFFMSNSTKPYFEAYLHDNQLESLIGRYFKIDYEIVSYDPDRDDDYFDIEDSENLAIELYSIAEVESF